jgi:predicted XRE-type DNA-binding protein
VGIVEAKAGAKMTKVTSYKSVWDAIDDTPEQTANLRARSDLMQTIVKIVKECGWTRAEAAHHCGVPEPHVDDLMRGRVSRFSLDSLVNIATAIGRRVNLQIEHP